MEDEHRDSVSNHKRDNHIPFELGEYSIKSVVTHQTKASIHRTKEKPVTQNATGSRGPSEENQMIVSKSDAAQKSRIEKTTEIDAPVATPLTGLAGRFRPSC